MYSPNCGCYNDENTAFCGSCGTPLRTEQSGREQPGQTAGAVPPYPGGQEMKRILKCQRYVQFVEHLLSEKKEKQHGTAME